MRGQRQEGELPQRATARRELLERGRELSAIEHLLEAAVSGRGRTLLIEGPPGIGKSRLVEAASAAARRREMGVLAAHPSQLEDGIALGVVRQLLGDLMVEEVGRENGHASSPATLAWLHQIVADLAADQALLIAVDDAQWADEASLRWLSYLNRRLETLPVLVVLAATSTPMPRHESVAALIGEAGAYVLRPEALSDGAVASLAGEALGATAHPDFCEACHAATRGNPLLVHALLGALHAAGVAGTTADAPAVVSIGPMVVARHVMRRLNGAEAPAEELLRAVAILGDNVDVGLAAALAGLDRGPAAAAADALARVDVLASRPGLVFTYPIIRAAIYSDLDASYKAAAHKRAARLLRSDATSMDAVARHLLSARRSGDGWVVEQLRFAAARALERGRVTDAVGYLRRALAEPPGQRDLTDVLFELGRAEVRMGARVGLDRLFQALEVAADPVSMASIALELGRQLTATANTPSAINVLEQALAGGLPDGMSLRAELEAALLRARFGDLENVPTARDSLREMLERHRNGDVEDPALLSTMALSVAGGGDAPGRAAALAPRALGASRRVAERDPTALAAALTALVWIDELDLASQVCSETLAEASALGSVQLAATALCLRSHVAFRQGNVDVAEADARATLELVGEGWGSEGVVYPTAFLIDSLIERGDLEGAASLIAAHGFAGVLPERWEYNVLLDSRARLRLAQRRHQEALDDLRECGRRLTAWGVQNPAAIAWRSSAAIALIACDERGAAQGLASSELVLARASESRRAFGVALRVAGVVQRGETGLQLLEEAVGALDGSGAQLEHAKALVDLAAMLRAAGRTAAARGRASRALDLAERMGATAVAQQAREEMVASGARPRRFARTGLDALTTRQREVAQLAGTGASNREIAERLFVSENTVETHLRLVFRKLEISSRAQLAELLNAELPLLDGPVSQ